MNGILFLIPLLLIVSIGLVQNAEAFEYTVGNNWVDITNPDGSHTWRSHNTYVLDEGSFVPFIKSGNTVTSKIGIVTLLEDQGVYNWDGKFNDRIIAKYADVTNQNNWIYPNTLNNKVPINTWDDDETSFTSSKELAGIGKLDYKYILIDGKWKTQLEVTNLSGLDTKVFGFDQIIDLNSDTIRFGGIDRNLDNYDGQTFGKTFLEKNQGKFLNLMNGVNFDFDLGFENLHSITVYDTGIDSSQLIFDYRTDYILTPNEILIIDPTFSDAVPTTAWLQDNDDDNVCENATSGDPVYQNAASQFGRYKAANAHDCQRMWAEWDISSIPPQSTVTDTVFKFGISLSQSSLTECAVYEIDKQPTISSDDTNWDNIANGTEYFTSTTYCDAAGNNLEIDLGTDADQDVEDKINGGIDWFAIGMRDPTDLGAMPAGNQIVALAGTPNETLEITYNLPPMPDAVDDLSLGSQSFATVNLYWSEPLCPSCELVGFQINMTTPFGSPMTIITANTSNTDLTTSISGLQLGTDYSFRIGSIGNFTWMNTTGNILNVTTDGNAQIGSVVFNQTNSEVLPITFEEQQINSTSKFLNVTFANTFDMSCDFNYKFANTNQTYSNLTSSIVSSTLNETSFIFNDYENEIIDVTCWDELTGEDAIYILTIDDFPLLQQIQGFRNGEYGTDGNIGVFDFVTLIVVIISMIGLNRFNESVGAIFNIILLGSLSFFGIIELPTFIFGLIALVLVFVITSTRKS